MRSWLQPALYVVMARRRDLGATPPHGLLFVSARTVSCRSRLDSDHRGRRWIDESAAVYSIAGLLWILPLLGVRTSGETV